MNQKKKYKPRPKDQKRVSDRKYYLKHREKILSRTKIYRDAHKDNIKEYNTKYRADHRNELLEDKKRYYREHSDTFKMRTKVWSENNPDRVKANRERARILNKEKIALRARVNKLSHYGLTLQDFDMMMQEQDGVCAICGRPPTNRALSIDHEHQRQESKRSPESRKVRIRGLLCHRCNRALGLFGNDLELLLFVSKNFAEYIEKYYAKRLVDKFGAEEAKRQMENTVNYLERFENRMNKK